MLIGNVHPTSIEGVKSLAAQYRKHQGIQHCAALDLAAKAAHCENYKHALRVLPIKRVPLNCPYVLLTIYWYDKKQNHRIGRETLKVELKRPIHEICNRSQLKKVRGFLTLRMVAPDHFVSDAVAGSQADARESLMTAERSLLFMEHTGLRPVQASRKVLRKGLATSKLPNRDHASEWVDPATGHFILIDEPYGGAPDEEKRADWAERTGWRVVKTSWPGMYRPYDCDLYVVTENRDGYDVDALVATINAMPAPRIEEGWLGESSSSWETFTSPMAKTPQDTRRARCRGTVYPTATKATLPYNYNMGTRRRRPAASMPVESHIEAGSIIKAVVRSAQCPFGAVHRLNSVRATLEDWLGIEIGRGQMDGPEFFEVYYRETERDLPNRQRAQSWGQAVTMLGELKQKLQAAYPDCGPLRQQIRNIDMSISLMGRLKPSAN